MKPDEVRLRAFALHILVPTSAPASSHGFQVTTLLSSCTFLQAGNVAGGGLAAKINSGESDAFVFNFSKGLLFDLTITGGLCGSVHKLVISWTLPHMASQRWLVAAGGVTTSDESANARVYANVGATPDQILAGAFPHPAEATSLYQALQS